MNININKDFEKEYKDESFRGFSMKEAFWIGAALCVAAATSIFLYHKFQIPLNLVLYAGLIPSLPFLLGGFYKYQDMSLIVFLKELSFERKTRKLCYAAGEYKREKVVAADRKKKRWELKRKKVQKRRYRKQLWKRRKR